MASSLASRLGDEAPRASLASAEVLAATQTVETDSCSVTISPPKQLLITDLAVVNDPIRTRWTGSLTNPADGAWHFGRLLAAAAGEQNASAFARSWIAQWETDQDVNRQIAPARPGITEILDYWPKLATGELDLTKAPFRLNAIVNRFDLHRRNDAGEGRLVYGLIDLDGNELGFSVILEYRIPASTSADKLAWARQWRDLGTAALGSAEYRAKLQALTDTFTRRGATPSSPNGSALAQVRTNELRFGGYWDLREFHLTASGQLSLAPLAQTPIHTETAASLNNTPRLARYLRENSAAILAQTHVTPDVFGCGPFAGVASANNLETWNAPGVTDATLRHRFALNTCNGCHGAETGTFFMHIESRPPDQESQLSAYLTGEQVPDPVTGQLRTFSELASRGQILRAFLCSNPS